ncbi:MAG: Hsp20/alpha crystallin family protein [Bacteroidales bacterium]|jgi:HSP20 family protein|nr:Hsp20/alpha crystallin family protein [Bacteroidales bacterium]
MTLVRFNEPKLRNFDNEVDNFFNKSFINEFENKKHFFSIPPANIIESKTDFIIEIAAPGFEKSDFEISLEKKLLTVSLDKSVDEDRENEKINLKEFSFNSFSRSFRLSSKVNDDNISAVYKNGMLQLVLPKMKEAIEKPKQEIKIL